MGRPEESWVEVIIHHPGKEPVHMIYEGDVEIHLPRRTLETHDTRQGFGIAAWQRTVVTPENRPERASSPAPTVTPGEDE